MYNKELLTIMEIEVIRDWLISSKNFKEYKNSRYRELPALLGLRQNAQE